jgi:hypothetical protein
VRLFKYHSLARTFPSYSWERVKGDNSGIVDVGGWVVGEIVNKAYSAQPNHVFMSGHYVIWL